MRQRKPGILKGLFTFVVVFFICGYIVYPLVRLSGVAFTGTAPVGTSLLKNISKAGYNSILLSICTVIGSLVIGTYFAYLFHFRNIWKKKWLSTLVLLPIAIPPMVSVMAYLFLLDGNGLLAGIFGHFTISGWTAILIVHLYSFYTLPYIFVGNHLKSLDNSMVEASMMLGATRTTTLWKVIIPQLKPALISSAMLVFMASMASFSAPFLFGGNTSFLSTEIYYSKINGNAALSALLSLLLIFISALVFLLFRWFSKNDVAAQSKGTAKRHDVAGYGKRSPAEHFVVFLFCALVILPVIALAFISMLPENFQFRDGAYSFSFDNYISIFSDPEFLQPLLNSIYVAVAGVSLTLLLSFGVIFLIKGKKKVWKSWLEGFVSLPYSIPGTVIAIGLILSFNAASPFSFGMVLAGTFWILPVAYTIRNLPVLTQSLKSGLQSVDKSLEEAASMLGSSEVHTWRSILIPLLYGALLEGILLVFINSFGEFVATVLLYTYDTKTIPIEIYAQIRLYNNRKAAAYGILLFGIILLIVFLVRKLKSRLGY